MNNQSSPDVMRKRLMWRANHRGIKEMDLLIGGFAAAHLHRMSDAELQQFEAILDVPDQEMLAWVTGQEQVPQQHASALLLELLNFRLDRPS